MKNDNKKQYSDFKNDDSDDVEIDMSDVTVHPVDGVIAQSDDEVRLLFFHYLPHTSSIINLSGKVKHAKKIIFKCTTELRMTKSTLKNLIATVNEIDIDDSPQKREETKQENGESSMYL